MDLVIIALTSGRDRSGAPGRRIFQPLLFAHHASDRRAERPGSIPTFFLFQTSGM